ncbi:hypothetical protein C7B61_08780, partial [filamentous cyanobacterium CCP1]
MHFLQISTFLTKAEAALANRNSPTGATMNVANAYRTANQFLSDLPDQDYEQLLPHLEFVSLPQQQILAEVGEPIAHAYFPIEAVISLLSDM